MAWQAPKTNWTGADGVRNTDLNRIEGNILELYNSSMVRSDTYLYVSPTGNDDTGTGTAASPYKTINKALSVIPRNLNGKDATISMAPGTYTEDVSIKGFSAPIRLVSTNGQVTVNNFTVDGCQCILRDITLKTNYPVFVTNCGMLVGTGMLYTNGAYISVDYASTLALDTVKCDNSISFAVVADRASRFYAAYLDGNANNAGLSSQGGSIVAFGDINMEIDSMIYFTAMGGRIYSGAQALTDLP